MRPTLRVIERNPYEPMRWYPDPSPGGVALVLFLTLTIGSGTHPAAPDDDGPPYAPEEALSTFEVADGFRIEPFAAEPLVMDPVAMEVDEFGQVYVVEMPGYPLDTGGSGRVVLLRDTNEDGLPDRRTVFADSLILPTGVMRWKNGVLVTDAPDVLYLEDTDGDGRADVRRAVLTGFARSNPQHNLNTPKYGLDNWIYLAHEGAVTAIIYDEPFGDEGDAIRYADREGGPVLPRNADGRNVRFRPDTNGLEAQSSESQFGHTFDAWGHQFLTHNMFHVFHEVIADRYLRQNPNLLVQDATANIAEYGYPADVFPITQDPEHQLLTDVGVITSAAGITYYLGGLFPEPYGSVAFVAEPVHNLVHAAVLSPEGATFRARRLFEGREFLASRDSWFRPVNFYVGPDGALYVIDYYRQIIEHPEWMSEEVAQSGELYNGTDRGRIYRVVPEGAPPPDWLGRLDLSRAPDAVLVDALVSPNVWRRRTAQRLLVDRRSPAAVPLLASLSRRGKTAEGRVHALWTLEGMGRLDPTLIVRAMGDPVAGVRENAIRLAELHLGESPALVTALLGLVDDPDAHVRFQLLNTLGYLTTPEATAARERLLFENVEDEWMQIAALTAESLDAFRLYGAAVRRLGDHETLARRALFGRLGQLMGTAQGSAVQEVITSAASGVSDPSVWWRAAVLSGITEGLKHVARGPDAFTEQVRTHLATTLLTSTEPAMRSALLDLIAIAGLPPEASKPAAMQMALDLAREPEQEPERRADAIRFLALADPRDHALLFERLAAPEEPPHVQIAAAEALGQIPGTDGTRILLKRWASLTPDVQDAALAVMMRQPDRTRLLLDAVEAGAVHEADLNWRRRVGLMMQRDEVLRERARRLLSTPPGGGEVALFRYRTALQERGDAERGREVFARVCSTCHQVSGQGGAAFGPDLGSLRNRTREALLIDILQPNRSIADGYEFRTVERRGGEIVQGVVKAESPTTLTIAFPGGATTTLPRGDVVSATPSGLSAMPEGLERQISVDEMADLLAFLKGE